MADTTTAYEGLSPEDRERLGLGVPPPKPKRLADVAMALGVPEEELAIMRGARNLEGYRRAEAEINELRRQRADREAEAVRDRIRAREGD